MTPTLVATGYGRASARALHNAVVAGKQGDPLAPVTVVVPTNYVGVAARRLLAGGTLGQLTAAGHGVAGVTFLTTYRLAELLGAPRLAGAHRRPVSTPVLAAAVRAVLGEAPGVFEAVAGPPVHRSRAGGGLPRALGLQPRCARRPGRHRPPRRRRRAGLPRRARGARAVVVRRARPDGRRGRGDRRRQPGASRSRQHRAAPAPGAAAARRRDDAHAGRACPGHRDRRVHRRRAGRRRRARLALAAGRRPASRRPGDRARARHPRRVGVGPRRRGAGHRAHGVRRHARRGGVGAHGHPLRRGRALRAARARTARRRRHPPQRRRGAHARRKRARPFAPGAARAPRPRLPPPRRHAPAGLGARVPPRPGRARGPVGAHQPRRGGGPRPAAVARTPGAPRPDPRAVHRHGAFGPRPRAPPRALRARVGRHACAPGVRRRHRDRAHRRAGSQLA